MFLGLRTGFRGGLLVLGGPVIKYWANSYVNSVFCTDPLADGCHSRRVPNVGETGGRRSFRVLGGPAISQGANS